MPPGTYPLPDTDPTVSGQPGSFNPQNAVPSNLDPATMSTLFGDDSDQDRSADESQGAPEDAGADVDQDKRMQNILSDPEMLKNVAEVLKHLGTGGDTDLVHVTDAEKAMLKRAGGKGTINPTTGLLQYASSGYQGPDWAGMTPDQRAKMLGYAASLPPGWSDNWWQTPGGAQGGPVANFDNRAFANANVAVNPSVKTALSFGGGVLAAAGGPVGLLTKAIGAAIASKISPDSLLSPSFDTPGPTLPTSTTDAVAAMPASTGSGTQSLVARDKAIQNARANANAGMGVQTGGQGPGLSAGTGYSREAGVSYGSNIGGGGISHNLASNASAGNIDRGGGNIGGGAGADARGGGNYGGGGLGGGPGAEGAGRDPGGPPGSQ